MFLGMCIYVLNKTRPRGYKTMNMLNPAEHVISNAHKYKYTKKGNISGSASP